MQRSTLYILIIVVCVGVAALIMVNFLRGRGGEIGEVIQQGQKIHVSCTHADCGYQQADYRAHSDDTDWPKTCPKCQQKTLCRAVPCTACTKYTPWKPDDKGRVFCVHCRKWLNERPAGGGPAGP